MKELTTCRSQCTSPHSEAIGYVTNLPDGYVKGRPHMAQTICARPECQRRAERQVREFTGEAGHFCEFDDAGASR